MIEFSIDRLTKVYKFSQQDSSNDDAYRELMFIRFFENIVSSLKQYKPDDVELIFKGGMYKAQIYIVIDDEQQPIFNLQLVEFQDSLRLDGNPKWWKSNSFIVSVMQDINQFALNNDMSIHTSQMDLAIDLIDEGNTAYELSFYKPGVVKSALYNSTTGSKETEYFGTRKSDSYLRIYDKRSERIKAIHKKYNRRKKHNLIGYDKLKNEFSNLSHQDILYNFSDLSLDIFPDIEDLSIKDNFIDALDWIMKLDTTEEINKLPHTWKRLELVLRTKKMNSDGITFEDKSVLDYLKNFHNHDLKTISDGVLRSVTIGVEEGFVNPKELSTYLNAQRRAILKYNEIVLFRDENNNTKIKSLDKFNDYYQKLSDKSKVKSEHHISKSDDFTLRDRIIEKFNQVKDDLKDELRNYTI